MDSEFWNDLEQFVKDECAKIDVKKVIAEYQEQHQVELDARQRALACARYICNLFEKRA